MTADELTRMAGVGPHGMDRYKVYFDIHETGFLVSVDSLRKMEKGPIPLKEIRIKVKLSGSSGVISTLIAMSRAGRAKRVTVAPTVQHWTLTSQFSEDLKKWGVI